jgi:hypothetical protein
LCLPSPPISRLVRLYIHSLPLSCCAFNSPPLSQLCLASIGPSSSWWGIPIRLIDSCFCCCWFCCFVHLFSTGIGRPDGWKMKNTHPVQIPSL